MQMAVMLLFYGFLSGIAVLFLGLAIKKRVPKPTAEVLSAAGGTLAACCFMLILGCGYLSTAVF